MRTSTFVVRLATAALVLGVASGCGGNSEPEVESTTEATTEATTEEPTEAEPTEEPTEAEPTEEPTEAEPTEEPTEAEPTETETSAGELDAFCATLAGLDGPNAATTIRQLSELMTTLTNSTPPEIQADVATVGENFQILLAAFEAAGVNPNATPTQQQQQRVLKQALAAGYDQAAAEGAADNITAWAADNCEGYVPRD